MLKSCSNVMATHSTLWLMSILTAAWCFSNKGPASPSLPDCFRPCDVNGCSGDITCRWDPNPDPRKNVTYILHWEGYKSGKSKNNWAKIQREYYTSLSELQVWVVTEDQDGAVSKSEHVTFNTADLIKPYPPNITSSSHEPMEIRWTSPCHDLMLEVGQCDVHHCTEAQLTCTQQDEGGMSGSYTVNTPEPCMNYVFQVRCACGTSLKSDWSNAHIIKSAERAPLGTLDVWRDCDMLLQNSECVLIWKKLPKSKSCGRILGYNLRLCFNNGTDVVLNKSVTSSVSLVCGVVHCYYKHSLKDVKSVSIDAYNALGVTQPSHLDMQVNGIHKEQAINLEMNENNLTVSWKVTSLIPAIKEYVVQYKEAGSSLGQGLDWIRVNSSLTKVTFKGQFRMFTAYHVSVFPVLDQNKIMMFYTGVAHFVQGKPAKVPSFKVHSYGTTYAILQWETVLMSVQNGVTPYYQVGYGNDNVIDVSAYPQMENRTLTLDNLKEDYHYEVWIKAVNQAGHGPNTTVMFKTLSSEGHGAVRKVLFGIFGVAGLLILLTLLCWRYKKACPAIPDPHNSYIIKEINGSMAWLCAPAKEQGPEISEIEIVKTSFSTFIPQIDKAMNTDNTDDPLEDILTEEHKKARSGFVKQDYSKMVDSDEEKNEEDETGKSSWSSDEDNPGYEQHFMPTDLDILEIEERERTE